MMLQHTEGEKCDRFGWMKANYAGCKKVKEISEMMLNEKAAHEALRSQNEAVTVKRLRGGDHKSV